MKIIYKYYVGSVSSILIPEDHQLLHVAVQKGNVYLWALVDTDTKDVGIEIISIATGEDITRFNNRLQYIGTIMNSDEDEVWHYFKRH